MSGPRPVVVVDPYSSGALFAPALRTAGLSPVAVTSGATPPATYRSSYRPTDFDRVVVHRGRLDETVATVRSLDPTAILPGAESGVELADRLAAAVTPGRANDPARIAARRHKAAMGSAVAAAGLPTVRQICSADPAEVAAWVADTGLQGRAVVVKPPTSAGTDTVLFVPPGDDWRPAFDRVLRRRNILDLVDDEVLVQEHLVGTEYVVDTCTVDGVHTVVDICRYRKVRNGAHMAVYDYLEWLPHDTPGHAELLTYATGVLDAVGMRFGAAHTEIIVTADGPRLVEVNARPAGSGVPRFARVATGDNQIDRLVRYCAGDRDIPAGFTLRRCVRGVLFLARRSGIVRNAELYGQVRGLASHYDSVVAVRSGDRVAVTSDLYSSHDLGYVVLAHDRPEQVRADYEAVRRIEEQLVFDS